MAEQLREVVRGKANAPLRQVETELMAHRAAEPGIDTRRRRPHGLDEAAEDDAVGFGEARFELAEDVELRARLLAPPHHAVGKGGLEHFGIVAEFNHEPDLLLPAEQIIEGRCEREAVLAFEGMGNAEMVGGKIDQHLAVTLGEFGEVVRLRGRKCFQRRQRRAKRRDQCIRLIEIALPQPRTRLGTMERRRFVVLEFAQLIAEPSELRSKAAAARRRPCAAQQRQLQDFDATPVGAVRATETK
jgi:hypothetical protein